MEWKTNRQLGMRVTIGIIAWLVIFDLLLIWIAVQLPITLLTFMMGLVVLASLPLFVILGYWLAGLRRSSYSLDRNALAINWGATQQVIPMSTITTIAPGSQVSGSIRFRGAYWPGLWVGHGEVAGVGTTLFYAATALRSQILFVITPGVAYAISPPDPLKFLEAFQQRKTMGPTQDVQPSSRRPEWLEWSLWSDKLAWGMVGVAALLAVLLFGVLAWRFPGLPQTISMHYNLAGLPDRMAGRTQVFILPLIGLLTLIANTGLGGVAYYYKEHLGAYLLWGGALMVQVLLWGACLQIIGG